MYSPLCSRHLFVLHVGDTGPTSVSRSRTRLELGSHPYLAIIRFQIREGGGRWRRRSVNEGGRRRWEGRRRRRQERRRRSVNEGGGGRRIKKEAPGTADQRTKPPLIFRRLRIIKRRSSLLWARNYEDTYLHTTTSPARCSSRNGYWS